MANSNISVNIDANSVMRQFEEQQTVYVPKKKNSFDVKNYLNTRLTDGESSKTMVIRLLPFSPEGGTPFKKVWIHTVKVDKEISAGGWRTFVCPIHNGFDNKCPFCETAEQAKKMKFEATTEAEKKKYNDIEFTNRAKEAWIVRVIERGHEEDGVKFWLFNHSRKKDGPYDKIMNLYNQRWNAGLAKGKENNIFDVNDGKDLILTVSKDSNNKTVIQVTDDDERSPLSENYEQACAWISDPKEWNTVYVAKPYDYTSIIVCGGIPVWDNEKHGWVDKTQRNAEKETAEQKDISENYTEQTKDYSNFEEDEPLKF